MARQLEAVDAVVVGFGWTGHIAARELLKQGVKVVALERGGPRRTVPDFQGHAMHDELSYAVRLKLMQDLAQTTLTFRNNNTQKALPMRKLGSFLPGTGVGGAGVHWNGMTWRYNPADFKIRSHFTERYGSEIFDEELTVKDWAVSYDDLEPYYEKFEYVAGISGAAGNLNGREQKAGNPFEGSRQKEFPNPPLPDSHAGSRFRKATSDMGLHPFACASANLSQPYTNTEGVDMGACTMCGFCVRYGCEHYAKASPQVCLLPVIEADDNFELRTGADVTRIHKADDGKTVTGVTYVRDGEELFQPASMVFLCAFALNNPWMLMLSGIGEVYNPKTNQGQVGRDYAYQTQTNIDMFFNESMNGYMGAGALATVIDDYDADNFDHTGLGFVGGSYMCTLNAGNAPILNDALPEGIPAWGQAWKRGRERWQNRHVPLVVSGSSLPMRGNHLDLDPTYTDALGRPLMRLTFDFPDNDLRMISWCLERATEIAQAMSPVAIKVNERTGPYTITDYQSTHNVGGTCMSDTPDEGVVNRYLQSWDCHNLFVFGASVFRHQPSYNPTGTVTALAYHAMDNITKDYMEAPGPMVKA